VTSVPCLDKISFAFLGVILFFTSVPMILDFN
jgi:hypothetical protein